MTIQVNTTQAKEILASTIQAKLVPMLAGSPGCGKSAIVHQLAKDYKLKVIDVRLAQCDPTDLLGFPDIDREEGKARYVPMSIFPIEGDELPEGYNGWLLFLDEFNAADRGVQKAAYKLILDRMIGEYNLHKNVAIVAAGNLDTDNAMVEEMTTALQSRLVHLELAVDQGAWLEWAQENAIDHRITSYIKFKPQMLYNFKPDHSDKTYSSPRTWEFSNRLLNLMDIGDKNLLPTLAGTISEGVAMEFISFTKIYKDLPTLQSILANPKGIPVPTEPSILFALTGALANHANKDNIDDLMGYITRIPIEFQVVCLREIHQRDRTMMKTPALQNWFAVNSAELY